MSRFVKRLLSLLALSGPVAVSAQPMVGSKPLSLVRVDLPAGVSLSIPTDWVVADAQSNQRRFDHGKAIMDLTRVPHGPGAVLLTASPDGKADRTAVTVSLIRRPVAEQADVAELDVRQVEEINQQFRQDLEAGMRIERARLIRWSGAARTRIGSLYSLVSLYTYEMPNGVPRSMESHRIFLGGGSIGFMLQAPVDEMEQWRPIFEAIRDTFRASTIR